MKKKFFTAVLTLCAVVGGLCVTGQGAADVMAQTGNNQDPVISGTSMIQVLKDDTFSTEDILSRVYAMDYEDGDLTQEIEIAFEDVNTAQPGKYTVTYQVTDSDGGMGSMTTTVEVVEALDTEGQKIQKTMYSKENADHLLAVELYRGYYHDRQHLGIYLNGNTSLKVRIVNWEQVWDYLTLDLLGDDSDVEKTYSIPYDGSWLTIPAEDVTEDLIPFIRTVSKNVQPVIEYYYVEDGMEELTYYSRGDDEAAFFDTWNGNDQQYAVLEGERITMLIPRRDKDSILNNPTTRVEYQFTTLDQMLDYYKSLQDQYDEFVGLVWDPEAGTDKNVRARYFAKADATGVGAAYYSGGHYTAENSESMNGYLKQDWMTMHEVAHGYDTSLAYGDIPLVETINNMLGYFYEKANLAEGDTGWSSMQYFELVEDNYMNQLKAGKTFATMEFDARLFCMLNVLTAADPQEMMSDLHSAWRKDGGNSRTTDFIIEHFSDTSGYNLVPYFEEYGLCTSEIVKSRIYEKNYPIANHFGDHFRDKTSLKAAKDTVGDAVNGLYGLASSDDMADLNLTGALNVNIQIDDLKQIEGKEVRILDGENEVAAAEITGEKTTFDSLPIGTYRVALPAARGLGYYTEYMQVTVRDGKTATVDAVYEKNTGNAMKDDAAIVLQGLSDAVFSTISTNVDKGTVTVTTEAIQPHYYFAETYAEIQVLSPDGDLLYTKAYTGNVTNEYQVEEFEAPVGSRILIAHLEIDGDSDRVQVKSQLLASICEEYMENYDSADDTVEYVVTENGLKRADWNDSEFNAVRSASIDDILAYMEALDGVLENRDAYQKLRAMVAGAVASLDEKAQNYYETTYPYLFEEEKLPVEPTPTPTPTPEPTPGFENPFTDVKEKDYFFNAVLWAVDNKITSGYSETLFAPKMTCTRAEVVTFLWRANGCPEPKSNNHPFTDVKSGKYYYKAILWAVENKITSGVTEELFVPNATVTRGQFAAFLWRAEGRPAYTVENPFSDFDASSYYYDAILWAYENKVTAGYYQDLFAPDMGCTRCQVVSFLYRAK